MMLLRNNNPGLSTKSFYVISLKFKRNLTILNYYFNNPCRGNYIKH